MVVRKINETVKEFYRKGVEDENFVMEAICKTLGGACSHSSKKEDMIDHIDIWWDSPKKGRLGIDVKGLKKSRRRDTTYDDTIHWLEIQNVRGDNGWLKGRADYIAFRTLTKIIFVKRETCLDFALKKIEGKETVYDTPKECYIPYKRKKFGRDDLTLKALNSDLEEIADFCIDLT